MRIILTILALLTIVQLSAQEQNYWVLLSDKSSTPYSIDSPAEFLSQRAIDRREMQGIGVDQRDLPADPSYIDQISDIEGVTLRYSSRWFNAIALRCEPSVLPEIEALPFVGLVKNAIKLKGETLPIDAQTIDRPSAVIDSRLPINYGLSENQVKDLNGHILHDLGYEGEGMVIAILDAGFDNVDSMETLAHVRDTDRILSTRDFVDGGVEVYEEHSHGRFVLSCIAGIKDGEAYGTATQASFHLLRTEDVGSESTVEEFNWIAAAEYADSVGADVLNTSLGYTNYDDEEDSYTYEDMDGNTAWITQGADVAASRGMLVVNSAGNSGTQDFHFIGAPADADSVLAIGSIDADSLHTSFSSFGPSFDGRVKPNVCAQGRLAAGIDGDDEVVLINGTSFSSPILAGLATCLWQAAPEATNMQVFEAIEMSAHLYSNPNDSLGYGIPNFGAALEILEEFTSGLSEPDANAFVLYPNPSAGNIELRFSSSFNLSQLTIDVYDIQGRAVLNEVEAISTQRIRMNTSNLSTGVYVIRVNDGERTSEQVFVRE